MSDKKPYDPYENEPLPEGEEAPPPHVHTMAIIRWVILGGLTIFAIIMLLSALGVSLRAAGDAAVVQYHCPMHPTYVSNQPGDCPICGMTLVPFNSKESQVVVASKDNPVPETAVSDSIISPPKARPGQYTCPMDPEVMADKPGKCPICGMKLVLVKAETSSSDEVGKISEADVKIPAVSTAKYTCPMDSDIVSEKPGRCPKCGMKLVSAKVADPPDPPAQMEGNGSMPGMNMPAAPAEKPSLPPAGEGDTSNVPGLVEVTLEPQRLQLIGLTTGKVEKRHPESNLQLVGYVTPDETKLANINVRTSGWVSKLFVDQTGQFVSKGERLLSVYSQDLYQAEQDYILARASAKKTSTDTTLTGIRNQLQSAARERLHLLGLPEEEINRLENAPVSNPTLELRSPFAGYVLDKTVLSGQYVTPDQNLFTVADLSSVWVIAEVYERDLTSIHAGQKVTAHFTAYPGEDFDGKIGFIYPSVSTQARTVRVRVEIANPSMKLRPGMYAEVNVSGGNELVLTAPADAIINAGDMQYAFVVHDKIHFQPRLVTIGRQYDDWTEILSGLSEGDEVVTNANFLIDSESRLKAAMVGMGGGQAGSQMNDMH